MIWLVLAALYLLGGLASSFPFALKLADAAGPEAKWTAQDAFVIALACLLWPFVWAATGWLVAFDAYGRASRDRRLARWAGPPPTIEEDQQP